MTIIQTTHTLSESTLVSYSSAYLDGNDYFEFTPLSAGNTRKWTVSFWERPVNITTDQYIFGAANTGDASNDQLRRDSSGSYTHFFLGSGSNTTTAKFRDPNAYLHHVWVFDSENADGSLRSRHFINNELVATGSVTQNTDSKIGSAVAHQIGKYTYNDSGYADTKFSNFYYINGQALSPTDFAGYDDNGIWVHKDYTGTYGTHDVHLDFNNVFRLGDDVAHTVDGYATWNPFDKSSSSTLSNSNLTYTSNYTTDHVRATIGMSAGKWYWEASVDVNTHAFIGFSNQLASTTTKYLGQDANGWGYYAGDGNLYHNGITGFGSAASVGDIIGIEFDADLGTAAFYRNGTLMNTITGLDTSNTYFPATGQNAADVVTAIFKETDWTYTPSTGFKALNVANLPTPSTYNTNEHFEVLTYKGNGGTQTIKGTDWGDDDQLVWIKRRDASSYSHYLYDDLRGVGNFIRTDSTAAQTTWAGVLSALNNDGFVVGSDTNHNASSADYVAWRFRAGTSASNTDGTITSTVSHNPTLGFSIVKWQADGTSAAGKSIGHGGSKKPCLIIYKNLDDGTANWVTWQEGIASTHCLFLNTTNGQMDYVNAWNDTDPSDSVITLGSWGNQSTQNYVAYIFFESDLVKPFSYQANAVNGDGPFVNTNGQPAFAMMKATSGAVDWGIADWTRTSSTTGGSQLLYPNTSGTEATQDAIFNEDTGFKIDYWDNAVNGNSSFVYVGLAIVGQQPQVTLTGNDFDNIGAAEQSPDNPSDTIATWNPLDASSVYALSNANKSVYASTSGNTHQARLSWLFNADTDVYFEVELSTLSATGVGWTGLGFVEKSQKRDQNFNFSVTPKTYLVDDGGHKHEDTTRILDDQANFAQGDVLMYAWKGSTGEVWFGVNGTWYDSGDPATGTTPFFSGLTEEYLFFTGIASGSTRTIQADAKLLESEWTYTAPEGFVQLSTANLPTPANVDVSQHFETLLYTGNGTSQTITGTDWEGDDSLVWIKGRNNSNTHALFDSVRGVGNRLRSDNTAAEDYSAQYLNAFNSDGFDIGSQSSVNQSGSDIVAWRFRAGTQVDNTDGTISSTVSVNPTLGFSIVKYTGNGTAGATIGHGLGKAPKLIILKETSTTGGWKVYHANAGATKYGRLDTTDAFATSSQPWNDTEPTSSVFTVWNGVGSGWTNDSGVEYIAYCFTDSDFIDISNYTGNANADGAFVYTDGTPVYGLFKQDAVTNWLVFDDKRGGYNPDNYALFPDTTSGEDTTNIRTDIVSTGWKHRITANPNNSGNDWLHLTIKKPFGSDVQLRAQ